MILRLFAPLLLAALAGCATPALYRAAEKPGTPGYSETRLTDNRYRVHFTGDPLTPSGTIENAALLRAAELTLQKGYDWFEVAERRIDRQDRSDTSFGGGVDFPDQTAVYQSCGLLGCRTVVTRSPGYSTGAGIATTTTRSTYAANLEIVIGKSPKPASAQAYDARQLLANLDYLKNAP